MKLTGGEAAMMENLKHEAASGSRRDFENFLRKVPGTPPVPEPDSPRKFRQKLPLTRGTEHSLVARVERDPKFARALLDEALTLFLNGEPYEAKLILRDLVNATVGFEQLAQEIGKPGKSVHRMLSASGNPTMANLSAIIVAVGRALKVRIEMRVAPV